MAIDFEALDAVLRDGRKILIWKDAPEFSGEARCLAWLETPELHNICVDPVMVARVPERLVENLRRLLPEEDHLQPALELLADEIRRRCWRHTDK